MVAVFIEIVVTAEKMGHEHCRRLLMFVANVTLFVVTLNSNYCGESDGVVKFVPLS